MTADERYETAIARRNIAWARWQDALAALAIVRDELGFREVRAEIREVNSAQADYEWRQRELIRERVIWRNSARAAAA